jgi:ribosomal protein S18 acetylase RimI-like enzyme
MKQSDLIFSKVDTSMVNVLEQISKSTFIETFASHNTTQDIEIYVNEALSNRQLYNEVSQSISEFYILLLHDIVIGYFKINTCSIQLLKNGKNANFEIERLYISTTHQGMGYGSACIQFCEERALSLNKNTMWLGVWEHNYNAIRFYQRHNYTFQGEKHFLLGNDRQTDFIMSKELNGQILSQEH